MQISDGCNTILFLWDTERIINLKKQRFNQMIYILIVITSFSADRLSKILIQKNMELYESKTIIKNIFNLTRTENTGMAHGMLSNKRIFLISVSFVLIGLVIYMFSVYKNRLARIGFSLIIGGAVGNMYDRIFKGAVTDFIDIPPISFIFPNFNMADICVTTGTVIIAVFLIFLFKEEVGIPKND